MSVSEAIGQEAGFLGISVLLGVGLFFLYDLLRIFRRLVPHGNIWIGGEDILYWLLCTGAVFVMLYQENDGMVRGFALAGVVLGMLLYLGLFSRYVIRVQVLIWGTVFGFLRKLLCVMFGPLWKAAGKILLMLRKQLKKFLKAVKIGLCKL